MSLISSPAASPGALVEALPQIVWRGTVDGAVDYLNARWQEVTGVRADQATGRRWQAAVHPDDLPKILQAWQDAAAGPQSFRIEHRLRCYDGTFRWMMTHAVRLGDDLEAPEKPGTWLGTCFDVHDFHQTAADLREAKEEANAANAAKSQFLANMSHEIRTPLSAMMGFADLLENETLERSERRTFLKTIIRNGQNLVRLIDDILDLAKVESGHLEIEHVRLAPAAILEDVTSLLGQQADAKGIKLVVERQEPLPDSVITDPVRIRQILLNIVGNAIKFTEHGTVRLAVASEVRDGGAHLVFVVTDTGAGMTVEQQRHLFQPFSQGDAAMTRRYGGTGLGLLLSRNLARHLGGDVTLRDSAPGMGSTFVATIAADAPRFHQDGREERGEGERGASQLLPGGRELEGERVLLVEDSMDFSRLLLKILMDRGAMVEVAKDGEEGVLKALRSDYDLVLMDVAMPKKDGIQATVELRRRGFTRPIVALTAHAMKEDRDRCFNAGCDDYLTKPVTPALLVQTAARYVSRSRRSPV